MVLCKLAAKLCFARPTDPIYDKALLLLRLSRLVGKETTGETLRLLLSSRIARVDGLRDVEMLVDAGLSVQVQRLAHTV